MQAGEGWGGRAYPCLPAKRWRAGAPLPQSRFSSKLLPCLLVGRESQGPALRGRGAAGAPLVLPPPHRTAQGSRGRRTPWLCGRASCPALPSGPQAGERQEKERKRQRTREGKGRRERQETRRRSKNEGGLGPRPLGRFSTAPADSARRGPTERPARAGKGGSWGRVPALRVLGRSCARGRWLPSCGWGRDAGGRSAAERARAGQVHVAPLELRLKLKGTARRAHHMEALPAPRPRPSVTRWAGPRRLGGRPREAGTGGAEPRPPFPLQSAAPGPDSGGSRGASSRANAHDPGPPLSPEPQILAPAPAIRSPLCGPGGGRPPNGETRSRTPIRFRPFGAPSVRTDTCAAPVSEALSSPAAVGGSWASRLWSPSHSLPTRAGRGSLARPVTAVPTGPSAPERCLGPRPPPLPGLPHRWA